MPDIVSYQNKQTESRFADSLGFSFCTMRFDSESILPGLMQCCQFTVQYISADPKRKQVSPYLHKACPMPYYPLPNMCIKLCYQVTMGPNFFCSIAIVSLSLGSYPAEWVGGVGGALLALLAPLEFGGFYREIDNLLLASPRSEKNPILGLCYSYSSFRQFLFNL